jgi:uncharacterized protein (DUF2237 family)
MTSIAMASTAKGNYEVVDFAEIPPTPCPCGQARRAFATVADFPATIHRTEISAQAKLHYHKRLTETYYFLECDEGAAMQLDDDGVHTVCAVMTAEFLAFSRDHGNDLSTPMPQYGFAGLKPGDRWCLCASRWKEALDAGAAPQVVLEATHAVTLHVVSLEELKKYAFRLQ